MSQVNDYISIALLRLPWSCLNSDIIIIYYIYIYIYIQSTPNKSDSQGTGKSVRLSEMSDLSEIQNIMQIRHEMRSAS